MIEQDHRRVKQRVRPMLGFKRLSHATITITGIELVHQSKKEQFDVSALCLPHTQTPQIWEAVLTARAVPPNMHSRVFGLRIAPDPSFTGFACSTIVAG